MFRKYKILTLSLLATVNLLQSMELFKRTVYGKCCTDPVCIATSSECCTFVSSCSKDVPCLKSVSIRCEWCAMILLRKQIEMQREIAQFLAPEQQRMLFGESGIALDRMTPHRDDIDKQYREMLYK